MVPLAALLAAIATISACPDSTTQVDTFSVNGTDWIACEDLQVHGGALVLVPLKAGEDAVWFPKGYAPYTQGPDEDYYLGLGKMNVLGNGTDMLGNEILESCGKGKLCEPTWERVLSAVPPIRNSGGANKGGGGNPSHCEGVRTFVGSRGSSIDATFSDSAQDCTYNGFPPVQSYVMNLTAKAMGEPPIKDFNNYINFTGMADGMVGGVLPNVIFYFPILPQNDSSVDAAGGSRYWTMIASPIADMLGGREQSVWFRFHQLACAGPDGGAPCTLHGKPQYYDTYWYSRSPIGTRWVPPNAVASANGFYNNMLMVKDYWSAELAHEGMMELDLPSPATTNGTYIKTQAIASLVRSMISREDTWHPRYGVLPGYGISLQDGFQDTFTATATAALEWGAFPYAKGVIDNHFRFYVQPNGGSTYRAEEVAVSSRMLTILALYASYTGDDAFLVSHFTKAQALGDWCLYRYNISLEFPAADTRHGIPGGDDEADTYIGIMYGDGTDWPHWYSSAGEMYRGFSELGAVWVRIGKAAGRQDIVEHGAKLLAAAPGLLKSARSSIATNTYPTGNPLFPRCYSTRADHTDPSKPPACNDPTDFRAVPEMLYSGILSHQQVDDIYMYHAHSQTGTYRPMTMGCTGYNNKQTTYIAYGMAYGLLQHDMIERFLLHFFAMAAHTYTRGTWTTPEACSPDKDVASTAYVAAGVVTAPMYLKWALVFEEPENKTLWVGKAVPRGWLGPGETPLVAAGVPTRYGKISLTFTPPAAAAAQAAASASGSAASASGSAAALQEVAQHYIVTANVKVSDDFGTSKLTTPAGGLRVRFRVPPAHAGKLVSVTVGGKPWTNFDAAAETVNFSAAQLVASKDGLATIVATFESA